MAKQQSSGKPSGSGRSSQTAPQTEPLMVTAGGDAPLADPLAGTAPKGRGVPPVKLARGPRVRLLPVVIFAAVLMLSVRLGSLWQDIQTLPQTLTVGQNEAFAQPSTTNVPVPGPGVGSGVGSGPSLVSTPLSMSQQLAQEQGGGQPPVNPNVTVGGASIACDPLKDPINLTQTEIDVLQKLAERREIMDKRERELETRENLLKAAEQRIDSKVSDMRTLEKTIGELLKKHDAQEMERINQLVKIYAAMKPVDAAAIFNDLEMDILLTIMENMKEAKSASILAAMDPVKARTLTAELSKRRRIPLPGQ